MTETLSSNEGLPLAVSDNLTFLTYLQEQKFDDINDYYKRLTTIREEDTEESILNKKKRLNKLERYIKDLEESDDEEIQRIVSSQSRDELLKAVNFMQFHTGEVKIAQASMGIEKSKAFNNLETSEKFKLELVLSRRERLAQIFNAFGIFEFLAAANQMVDGKVILSENDKHIFATTKMFGFDTSEWNLIEEVDDEGYTDINDIFEFEKRTAKFYSSITFRTAQSESSEVTPKTLHDHMKFFILLSNLGLDESTLCEVLIRLGVNEETIEDQMLFNLSHFSELIDQVFNLEAKIDDENTPRTGLEGPISDIIKYIEKTMKPLGEFPNL